MLFDSPAYFIFLIIVVLLYWRLSWRRQNVLLLCVRHFEWQSQYGPELAFRSFRASCSLLICA